MNENMDEQSSETFAPLADIVVVMAPELFLVAIRWRRKTRVQKDFLFGVILNQRGSPIPFFISLRANT